MSKELDDALYAASDYSLFGPESLKQVRDRLEFIDAHDCDCDELPHSNALHDLAHDDVPVLIKVIEQQAAEVERLRRGGRTLGKIIDDSLLDVLKATDSFDLVGDDLDGDWMAVFERLAELRPARDAARAGVETLRAQLKVRTIETVAQLDALPAGSVVMMHEGMAIQRDQYLGWSSANDDGDAYESDEFHHLLPARLLWHPEVDA